MQNAHLQSFFSPLTVKINDVSEEMEGFVAPTDSRWRGDLRFFEEDRIAESEAEKL